MPLEDHLPRESNDGGRRSFESSHAKRKTLRTASFLNTDSRGCTAQQSVPMCPGSSGAVQGAGDPPRGVPQPCWTGAKLSKVVRSLPARQPAQLLPCHAVPCLGASFPVGSHPLEKQQAETSCVGLLTISASVSFRPAVLFFFFLLHPPLYIDSQLKNESASLQTEEAFGP